MIITDGLYELVKKIKEISNSEYCFTHDFRHTYAFHFLKKCGNMYQLQAILGHKTIGMTIDLYGQLRALDVEGFEVY